MKVPTLCVFSLFSYTRKLHLLLYVLPLIWSISVVNWVLFVTEDRHSSFVLSIYSNRYLNNQFDNSLISGGNFLFYSIYKVTSLQLYRHLNVSIKTPNVVTTCSSVQRPSSFLTRPITLNTRENTLNSQYSWSNRCKVLTNSCEYWIISG